MHFCWKDSLVKSQHLPFPLKGFCSDFLPQTSGNLMVDQWLIWQMGLGLDRDMASLNLVLYLAAYSGPVNGIHGSLLALGDALMVFTDISSVAVMKGKGIMMHWPFKKMPFWWRAHFTCSCMSGSVLAGSRPAIVRQWVDAWDGWTGGCISSNLAQADFIEYGFDLLLGLLQSVLLPSCWE